jgi:2-polyprenyl-6-methoxyphenol hydroxylase-like FAD-dependent oxidoreductase
LSDKAVQVTHRADLLSILVEECTRSKLITIRLNSMVTDVDIDRPALRVGRGSLEEADIILAADGIKSITRKKMLESEGQVDQGAFDLSKFESLSTLTYRLCCSSS